MKTEPIAKIFISPYSNNKLEIVNGFAKETHKGVKYLFDDLHGQLSPLIKKNGEIIYVMAHTNGWIIKKDGIVSFQKKLPIGLFLWEHLTDVQKWHNEAVISGKLELKGFILK